MAKPNSFDAVIEALSAIIDSAPDQQKDALAQALEDYANTYRRSWNDLIGPRSAARTAPALSRMLLAIEEASEARIQPTDDL